MSRLVAPATFLALAAGLAAGAPVPAHLTRPVTYYYPTQVGAKWVYVEGPTEWTEVVSEVKPVPGGLLVTVSRLEDGEVSNTYKVEVTGRGLSRVENGGRKDDPPLCWLRLPAKAGEAWASGDPDGRPDRVTTTGTEEVTVPAGTYRTVRVVTTSGGGRGFNGAERPRWYAPGIGKVKSGDRLVLKSFTPGRP